LIALENKFFLLQQQNELLDKYVYTTTFDLHGNIIDISQAYLDFMGYQKKDIIGKNHSIFRSYDLDTTVINHLWETITNDKVWVGELKNIKYSGEEYWIKAIISPIYNKENVKIGYFSIKQDISEKKIFEEISIEDPLTLMYNRRYFDKYFKQELNRVSWKKEYFSLILLGVDYYEDFKDINGRLEADRIIVQISNVLREALNSKIHKIFKVTELEFAIILFNYDDSYITDLCHTLLTKIETSKIKNPQSTISDNFTLSIGAVNINTATQNLYCNDIYNLADINLSKAKTEGRNCTIVELDDANIKELKNIDIITKLPNKGSLIHDISTLHEEAMLIILHIRQISTLKNLYGFEFVSKISTIKAQELQNIIRDDEVSLYSLNIKEFAILITNKNLFEKYTLLLKHSILVNNEFYVQNLHEHISADFTVGVSFGMGNIFNHADLVLQEAILSKINYKVYKSNQSNLQLKEDNLKRLQVYKHALHNGNIIPYFQPIVDTTTKQVVKYEALARLETDDGEIISPYYFLESAKEDKPFEYFTRQMMQKVFNVFSKNNIEISMNLSYENINSQTMVDYIKNRLEKYGGEGITFEILETEDIKNYEVLEQFTLMIKQYGCKISIDDFGSGYSNFTHILRLNLDYIKLDGSLIQRLDNDENVKHMIKGLLVYAKNTNIKTIAEFVSSKELSISVQELGVDFMQGYYYGEPKAPQEYGLSYE